MNVNLKRLLSFLVVMALVLGMVPATGIPAVTAKAEETEQATPTYADNLTFAEGTTEAWCPGCGASVTWTALTDQAYAITSGSHYYLADDLTFNNEAEATDAIKLSSSAKLCLHLNGHTYSAKQRIYNVNGIMNVYSGDGGKVQFLEGVATGFQAATGAVTNLYGGTYSFQEAEATGNILYAVAGEIYLYGNAEVTGDFSMNTSKSRIRLCDAAVLRGNCNWVTTSSGYICLMEGWTGELVTDAIITYPAKVIVSPATAALQGTVKDTDGFFYEKTSASAETLTKIAPETEYNQTLVFLEGTQKAWCPGCQKTVTWTELTGNISTGTDKHYYLADDLNLPVGETATDTNGRIYLYSGATVCLHLNNHTYTSEVGSQFTNGTLNVYAGGDNGKMVFNIADGFTKAYAAFRPTTGTAIVNLYGGTYTANEGKYIAHNAGLLSLYGGAKLEGAVYYNAESGYVTLYDTSTIVGSHTYRVETYKNPILDESWTGTLTLTEAEAAHVAVEGTLAGTVTNAEGAAYIQNGTGLVLAPAETTYNQNLAFAEGTKLAYCPGCEKIVTWTAMTGFQVNGGDHAHYYLDNDYSYNGSLAYSIAMYGTKENPSKLCLHLNGKTYTARNISLNAGATVKIYGGEGGKIDFQTSFIKDGAEVAIENGFTLKNGAAGLSLYGGTYTYTGTGYVLNATSAGTNLYGDAKLVGNANLVYASACVYLNDTALVDGTYTYTRASETSNYPTLTLKNGWAGEGLVLDAQTVEHTKVLGTVADGVVKTPEGESYVQNGEALELPVEAVETTYNQNLVFIEGTTDAWCPGCKETVTWTALEDKTYAVSSGSHYYLADALTFTNAEAAEQAIKISGGAKLCLHLNGKTYTTAHRITAVSGTLNVYSGNGGAIIFNENASGVGFTQATTGITYNLYGGTYTYSGTGNALYNWGEYNLYDATVNGNVYHRGESSSVNLYGTSTINGTHGFEKDYFGEIVLKEGWTGTLTLTEAEAAQVVVEGTLAGEVKNAEGTAYIQNGTGLVLTPAETTYNQNLAFAGDTKLAYCPGCKEVVTWTALGAYYNQIEGGGSAHYYLDGDLNCATDNATAIAIYGGTNVCLHLNGNTYSNAKQINISNGTLDIYAGEGGEIVFNTDLSVAINVPNVDGVKANLWGGTYTFSNTEEGKYAIEVTSKAINLYDATLNGNVHIKYASYVTLYGTSAVNGSFKFTVASVSGKIVLAEGWKGTLTLTEEEAANVTVNGTLAGTVTTPEGESYVQNGNALELPVEAVETTYNQNLVFIEGTTDAWCPGCKETVTWTALADQAYDIQSGSHYYLADALTFTNAEAAEQAIKTSNGATVCLHLNGKTYTVASKIYAVNGTLNVYSGAGGAIVFTNGEVNGFTQGETTTKINLYGGTYTHSGTANALYNWGEYNLYDATVNGNVYHRGSASSVNLYGTSTINGTHGFEKDYFGEIVLKEGWTGTLTLTEAEAAQVAVEGTLAGTVTNAEGTAYIQNGTGLVLKPVETTYNQNLAFAEGTTFAYCPDCKEYVTWTALTGGYNQFEGGHYYLNGDLTHSTDASTSVAVYGGLKACLHLNGNTYTAKTILNSNGNLNIYAGEGGQIVFDGSQAVGINQANKEGIATTLWGGTYTYPNQDAGNYVIKVVSQAISLHDAKVVGNVDIEYKAARVRLYGSSTIEGGYNFVASSGNGLVVLQEGWNGNLVLDEATAANVYVTGTLAGTVKNAEGKTYVQAGTALVMPVETTYNQNLAFAGDTKLAYCPGCKEVVTWTALGAYYNQIEGGGSAHYYLDGDLNCATSSGTAIAIYGGTNVCLHLNGNTYSNAKQINISNGTLDIYAGEGGEIVFNTDLSVAIKVPNNDGVKANLWGGSYTFSNTEEGKYAIEVTSKAINLYDATVNGNVHVVYASYVTLYGTSTVNGSFKFTVASVSGQIVLAEGWKGTLTLTEEEAANVTVKGTLAGVVKTADNEIYTQVGSGLQLGVPEVDKNVFDPENNRGYAYCKHCDNVFQWQNYNTLGTNTVTEGAHLYLTADVTHTVTDYFLMAKADVCFNLNGFDVTAAAGAGSIFYCTEVLALMNTETEESVVTGGQPSGSTVGSFGAALTLVGSKASSEAYLYDNVRLTKLATVQTQAIVGLSYNGGKFYMKGGVIDGTGLTNSSYAVCVYVGGGSYKAEFYMEGGQIIGGEATNTSAGGAVAIGNPSGEVSADKQSVFKMTGGTISGGIGKLGANIKANKNCATVEILGGTVTGGTATGNGGNINVSGADLTIGGDAVISNGTVKDVANRGGGNIAFANGTLTISGGTITGGRVENSSGGSGGNIKLENSTSGAVTFIMTGGKVTNGYVEGVEDERSATNYGGNIRAVNPVKLQITGGEITGGTGCSAECADSYNMMITYQEDFLLANPDTAVTIGSVTMDGGLQLRNGVNNLKFTGAPKISGIRMDRGILADVSELTEGAEIEFINVPVNTPITTACDNIEDVKGYITINDGVSAKVVNKQLVVDGLAVVVGDVVTYYTTTEEALTAYKAATGAILRLGVDELVLDGGEYVVDAAGYGSTTGAISGTGTVKLIDTANADLMSFRQVTVASGITLVRDNVENEVRYIVVTVDGITSAHVLQMAVDSVNLNTEKTGLAFGSTFNCDAYLAALVGNYGIIASVNDMPGAEMSSSDKRTELQNFAPGAEVQSSYITGIFKESRTASMNAQFGKMKIFANAYIELDLDGDGTKEILVADTANVGAKANGWSLYDVLNEIDDNWADYSEEVQTAVRNFYGYWADYGMDAYEPDFVNIIVEVDNGSGEGDAAGDEDTDADVPV